MPDDDAMHAYQLKAPRELFETLGGWARMQGRPLSQEMRLDLDLMVCEHTLNALSFEEGQAQCRAQGNDVEEQRAKLEAAIARLRAEIFRRPSWPAVSFGDRTKAAVN